MNLCDLTASDSDRISQNAQHLNNESARLIMARINLKIRFERRSELGSKPRPDKGLVAIS